MLSLATLAGVRAAFPDDRFLAHDIDEQRVIRCAMSSNVWSIRGRSAYWSADWVTVWSVSASSDTIAAEVQEHFSWHTSGDDGAGVRGITCNEAVRLPTTPSIEAANDWSWFWTDQSRARCTLSSDVQQVEHHDPRLLELLTHSPTASHERDGQPPAAWFGIEQAGELLSVAAVKQVGNCYDIQSVVTHGDARGQGLSSKVCSHTTAWGLQRLPVVALGMMTDNVVAERLYTRLGFACEKRWQSARFAID